MSIPVPSDDSDKSGAVTQPLGLCGPEQPGRDPQADNRRCFGRLTIPATFPRTPAPSSSCTKTMCEPLSPPFSALMHDSDHELACIRNVVVFGESGVGKSSVINMIAGKKISQTSNGAVGCTFRYQCYQVPLDGLNVNLWDTIGLDEGTEGTVPAVQAESSLKAFLRHMARLDGIDLLLYCVRGTRVRQALLRNYNIFYAAICRKKVPVALVVTGLENYEGDMDAWWTEHEKDLIRHGMRFDAHACVTTIQSNHPAIQDRLKQSRDVLCNLLRARFDAVAWRADEDSLISASLPDVRALLQSSEKRVAPFVMIYDAPGQTERVHLRLFPATAESHMTCINDRKYQCLHVDPRQLLPGDSKFYKETIQRPDLLIFYADAGTESDQTWVALEQFHASCGGETCPIIIVFGGLDSHQSAVEMWRSLSYTRSSEIIASPTYYPCPHSSREADETADEALASLVEEKCLTKFEGKVTIFQKFCRQTKSFFGGQM